MVGSFAVRGYRQVVVRLAVLPVLLFTTASSVRSQQPSSVQQLIRQFESETEFTRQFQVAQAIVTANDRSVLLRLEPWLRHKDRCLRGNAAYIFARLGDSRGFDVIVGILGDRSADREVHFVAVNPLTGLILGRSLPLQIRRGKRIGIARASFNSPSRCPAK